MRMKHTLFYTFKKYVEYAFLIFDFLTHHCKTCILNLTCYKLKVCRIICNPCNFQALVMNKHFLNLICCGTLFINLY